MGAKQKKSSVISTAVFVSLFAATVLVAGYVSRNNTDSGMSLCAARQLCYSQCSDLDIAGGCDSCVFCDRNCASKCENCEGEGCENCKVEPKGAENDAQLSAENI